MSKKFMFETGAYGVELSSGQWSAIHDIFENYNEGDEMTFVMEEGSINGLVSEILVALDLAPCE